MLELGVKFLLSYFIGSIMGSLVIGYLYGGVDIRKVGSGNAGGTNALRTQGWVFALGVVLIDIGKGAIGAGVIPGLNLPLIGSDPAISRTWLTLCCAAGAVVGHVWPMWHDFKGGKGAATLIGTLAVLGPQLIVPVLAKSLGVDEANIKVLAVWGIVLVLFGYVGLATMSAAVFAPVYLVITELPDGQPLFIYCAAMALYLLFSHRSNVQRMRDGTEFQYTRVMLFRRG